MNLLKRFTLLLVASICVLGLSNIVFADAGDEATLGGQDSDRNYRWRVTSSGHLIPGSDDSNDIGDATHEVRNIYIDGTANIDTLSSGAITGTSTIQFNTTIFASGHNSGATTVSSWSSNLDAAALAYGIIRKQLDISDDTDQLHDLANGLCSGQMVTIILDQKPDNGRLVIPASGAIATGWNNITFDNAGDSVTVLWVDATVGWIVVSNNGCEIQYIPVAD